MSGIEDYLIKEQGIDRVIAVHLFWDIMTEVMTGAKTAAEGKAAFEAYVGEALSSAAQADLTNIFNYIDAGSGWAGKRERADLINAAISAGQHGIWYNTRALLRTKLISIIT